MIEAGAIVLAVIQLILSILDDRRATRPQRERAQRDEEYDRDINESAEAVAAGDASALTTLFEGERRAAVRRGDLDPSPPGELP